MKQVIFFDKKTEQLYLDWLHQLQKKVEKFSETFNDFAEKIGIDKFSAKTLSDLKSNIDNWAASVIGEAVKKYDVPLRNSYMEYFYSEFNKIKADLRNLNFHLTSQSHSKVPVALFSLENFPEIVDGKLVISDEFLNDKKKFFEVRVETDSEAYRLLNLFMETYNALYEMGKDTGAMATPITFGRAEGVHVLTSIETFLQRRNDGSVTINNYTLNKLQ